jgi:hypothetical protein
VTRAVEQLRTLGAVAVWNLAAPAVIRPRRDGWLIFIPGEGYAWYGTAEAAAYRPDSAAQAAGDKRAGPGHAGTGGYLMPGGRLPGQAAPGLTRQRSHPAAQGAVYREPSCRPCRMHCPVTQHRLR